jgi:hypothetical protein
MTSPSRSLRCRYCRADNPAGSTCCWLCDAPDWSLAPGAPDKAAPQGLNRRQRRAAEKRAPGAPDKAAPRGPAVHGTGYAVVSAFWIFVLFAVTFLIVLGIWLELPGLAALVALVWWIALASAGFSRLGRTGVRNPFIRAIATIVIVLGTLVVTVVSVMILLVLVCQVSGKTLNLH